MRTLLLLIFCLSTVFCASAQKPLYFVNGVECSEVKDIDESDIDHIETLAADEQTVARYGTRASGGVVLITLRYDTPASFDADGKSFTEFITSRIKWDTTDPAARVVVRYRIDEQGAVSVAKVLEATDRRLQRKVLAAIAEAPRWTPATKGGKGITSEKLLRIQLPEGRPMPRERYVVLR